MYTNAYMTMNYYSGNWREIIPAVLPKPAKTIGRKLCDHDSTTPPLDFRLSSESPV